MNLPAVPANQRKSNRRGGRRAGAGRKKGSFVKLTESVRAIALEYGPDAMAQLARIAEHSPSDAARVSACREILDRAYGKAPQPIVGDEARPIVIHAIKWLQPLE